jgi:hypothetical protein
MAEEVGSAVALEAATALLQEQTAVAVETEVVETAARADSDRGQPAAGCVVYQFQNQTLHGLGG